MNNELWDVFVKTGSIKDYLNYKHSDDVKADNINAGENQGTYNQRTDDRGE